MIRCGMRIAFLALVSVVVGVSVVMGGRPACAKEVPSIAVISMELINTSLQPTSDVERGRIVMIKTKLAKLLEDSGRYIIVPLPPSLMNDIDSRPNIAGCGGCQYQWGKQVGADLVVWGTVQKVSNLILNINVYMDDVKTQKSVFGASVDIRGNTDESWDRGIRYLVKHNILKE